MSFFLVFSGPPIGFRGPSLGGFRGQLFQNGGRRFGQLFDSRGQLFKCRANYSKSGPTIGPTISLRRPTIQKSGADYSMEPFFLYFIGFFPLADGWPTIWKPANYLKTGADDWANYLIPGANYLNPRPTIGPTISLRRPTIPQKGQVFGFQGPSDPAQRPPSS